MAATYPDLLALEYQGRKWTYREVETRVEKIGRLSPERIRYPKGDVDRGVDGAF